MTLRLVALSICLAIMVAVLFFGIVPAVMPGRTLMADYRKRLDKCRDDHGWEPASVSQAMKLADGEFASGLLMMRTMEGDKQYRHMSVAEELLTRMEMGQDF